ncbi:Beta_elim_lyase domain-containing protein [Caenorhabditis elegans]|uniref:Isoform a of Uncharacterized protein R102.4 n=1 Tax=Caenorhabditis elegans TaxID=6239 RepID=Q21890-2|nr:Beta_elim_lyase domain-containing protein [Caenorhabditis elegans]CAB54291.3 Beta_elim_lyase domain-containing protein [Caenorhabditis elegans]|eukprot:NP_501978.3 Uncharacterized protein CELE_R102.4 [Caenorhabditis elegans]
MYSLLTRRVIVLGNVCIRNFSIRGAMTKVNGNSNGNGISASTDLLDTPSAYTQKSNKTHTSIDLRSDTVTVPSVEMRRAMAEAIVGDDVYGEDTTTNRLEQRCAELFGKEAGLFVTSGTMGNLLAIMAHCQRGEEIIVGRYNHIHRWEQGNYAQFAGISATTLEVKPDGTMDLNDIEQAIRVKDCHMPASKLICIENTHNYTGGKALPIEWMRSVKQLAERRDLKVHMDGARIYNAAVASNCSVSKIASFADTVQMCFSKGLGAPVGSIVVGPKDFIDRARHSRKALGGGWRQSGILAAAAHIALDHADATIRADHERAKTLARMINDATPEEFRTKVFAAEKDITNMVLVHCQNGVTVQQLTDFFQKHDILAMTFDARRIRMVLNWNVSDENLETIVEVYKKFLKQL